MVYAKCDYSKRRNLWNTLSNINNVVIPWCIASDFNCIISDDEKLGGNPFSRVAKEEFRSFVNQLGLFHCQIRFKIHMILL